MIAHGVSRGFHVRKDPQPQRGDRHGRLQCSETSREAAKPRRSQDVVSRRDAKNAEGAGRPFTPLGSCLANANAKATEPGSGLCPD